MEEGVDQPKNIETPNDSTTQELRVKAAEPKLKSITASLFKDNPNEQQPVVQKAEEILSRYNLGEDLDMQFYADIIYLAGEETSEEAYKSSFHKTLPKELKQEFSKEGSSIKDRSREEWWVDTAYRLLRERQGNPIDQNRTVFIMIDKMRPKTGNDKHDKMTEAIKQRVEDLLARYKFGISPDVKFLWDMIEYADDYELATNYELYPEVFSSKAIALRNKKGLDIDEPKEMQTIYQDFLNRQQSLQSAT